MQEALARRAPVTNYLDWVLMRHVAGLQRSGEMLHRYLAEPVRRFSFRRDEATASFYGLVATFLEEGWRNQGEYRTLNKAAGAVITLDDFGLIMLPLVRGYRYEQWQANLAGAPWLGEGEWPTRCDTAAYLFFRAMEVNTYKRG